MKNKISSILITALSVIAIAVCIICDFAIGGKMSWSLITTSSIVLAWLISIPIIKLGKKGISVSLAALSISIIPYLYVLSILIKENAIFTIGAPLSVVAIIYVWCIFGVFKLLPKRKIKALGISLLLSLLFFLIINIILHKMILEPIFDSWDMLSVIIIIISASILFVYDRINHKE